MLVLQIAMLVYCRTYTVDNEFFLGQLHCEPKKPPAIMHKTPMIKISIVDDHVLFRNALTSMINGFGDFTVINQHNNGQELCERIAQNKPDIILLDLSMPIMNGFETAAWLQKHHPEIPILMLTMYDSDMYMLKLLRSGVKGFLKKTVTPSELKAAIHSVMNDGYYCSKPVTRKLMSLFCKDAIYDIRIHKNILSDQECDFLKLICTDFTYPEVAHAMGLNARTVDTIRAHLFLKLEVTSRVGLAMAAVRHGIVAF
jgi:two-component system, NarL family, invasion response regulator UvrY